MFNYSDVSIYNIFQCYLGEMSIMFPMQKILGEFVTVEMAFHAKALEIYTCAYQDIQNVDEEGDLEVSALHQNRCSDGHAGLSLSVLMSNQIILFLLPEIPLLS